MSDNRHNIRMSMLPGYFDCARRAAAKQFRKVVEEAGYALNETKPSIGAAVGTAVHTVVGVFLNAKMEDPELSSLDHLPSEWFEAAQENLVTELSGGFVPDETTPTIGIAQQQVMDMAGAYIRYLPASEQPVLAEHQMQADIPGYPTMKATGKLDALFASGRLDDLKTGGLVRPYQAQIGGYILIARSLGAGEITSAGTTFIQRRKKDQHLVVPIKQDYDVEAAEQLGWQGIQTVAADLKKFSETGDKWAFRSNPMSMMCEAAYCPAFGTTFCDEWKGKKREKVSYAELDPLNSL